MAKSSETPGQRKLFKLQHPILCLIWLSVAILAASAVWGAPLPMCEDTIEITSNCQMVTPNVLTNCTTYDVLATNGTVAINDTLLTPLNGDIYYFNFTLKQGDYVVRLCDGSTREVRVKPDTGGRVLGVSVILGLLLFVCLGLTVYFTVFSKSMAFKYLFLLLTIVFIDMTVFIGAKMAADGGQSYAFAMWRIFWIMVFMTFVFFAFLFVHWVIWSMDRLKGEKEKKEEELYGPAWRV